MPFHSGEGAGGVMALVDIQAFAQGHFKWMAVLPQIQALDAKSDQSEVASAVNICFKATNTNRLLTEYIITRS